MIEFTQKGDWSKTIGFLESVKGVFNISKLDKYGRMGVEALAEGTPKDTGKTAASWDYEIKRTRKGATIFWKNTNINDGEVIAVILQYGHGIDGGGWVEGTDYINPIMRPVFEQIANDAWKDVIDN